MKKILGILSGLVLTLAFAFTVSAAENWDLTGTYTIDFVCTSGCSGTYTHLMNVTSMDLATGDFLGTGNYYGPPTWTHTGNVNGSSVGFVVDYDSSSYYVNVDGIIASDGSMSGTASNASQEFTWSTTAGYATFNRHAEITAPDEDEIVYGDVSFEAYLMDNDLDHVSWAVREGTCAAGTNTVFGNVDGHSNTYLWTLVDTYKYEFTAVADTSGWDGGMYCFIFNPREDSGETGIRLTREFYVAEGNVHGGGQMRKEIGPKTKDDYKISFGGQIWDLGSEGIMGDWEVNLHNVGVDGLDQTKFHTTEITNIVFYTGNSDTCDDAVRFDAVGRFGNKEGYRMIFRAGDLGNKNTADTARVEIFDPDDAKVYDTYWPGEFGGESSCVGSARTDLDKGNITIWH